MADYRKFEATRTTSGEDKTGAADPQPAVALLLPAVQAGSDNGDGAEPSFDFKAPETSEGREGPDDFGIGEDPDALLIGLLLPAVQAAPTEDPVDVSHDVDLSFAMGADGMDFF